MTRVLVVDDHPIVLQGCARLLADLGVEEVTEKSTIAAAYRYALCHEPQAIVTDLTFAGDDLAGLALIERIAARRPAIRILVFSMHNDPAIVSRALAGGALAYVLKDAPSGEFTLAFERLCNGQPHLGHELAVQVAMMRAKTPRDRGARLTEREDEILLLLGRGYGYDRIARTLGISTKTVTNVTSLLRSKLGLTSLAGLLRHAQGFPEKIEVQPVKLLG